MAGYIDRHHTVYPALVAYTKLLVSALDSAEELGHIRFRRKECPLYKVSIENRTQNGKTGVPVPDLRWTFNLSPDLTAHVILSVLHGTENLVCLVVVNPTDEQWEGFHRCIGGAAHAASAWMAGMPGSDLWDAYACGKVSRGDYGISQFETGTHIEPVGMFLGEGETLSPYDFFCEDAYLQQIRNLPVDLEGSKWLGGWNRLFPGLWGDGRVTRRDTIKRNPNNKESKTEVSSKGAPRPIGCLPILLFFAVTIILLSIW